jgi:hypothetical protein
MGRAHGVCDGSYMPKLSAALGAASWIVKDPDSGQAKKGKVQTSGTAHEVDSSSEAVKTKVGSNS